MPKIVIRNRRPVSTQPTFTPIPDYKLPIADWTTGNVTLPASLGGDILAPGASVTKTYNYLSDTDLETLLALARVGQINFPGSETPYIPKGLHTTDKTYCLDYEEPTNVKEGAEVVSIYTGQPRRFNGDQWNTVGYDSWKIYSTLSSAQARNFHRMVELPNGEVLIIGGYSGYVTGGLTATIPAGKTNAGQLGALCHRFDPKTGKLTASCPMPSDNVGVSLGVRGACVAVLLPNGLVFAGGGSNFEIGPNFLENPASCFSDFWTYNPSTDDWTARASSPETMSPHTQFMILKSGKVFVAGPQSPGAHTWPSGAGATTLEKARFNFNTHTFTYDYVANTWSTHGNMNRRRCFGWPVELNNGKVLIWGGRADFQERGIMWNDGETWDPGTGNWTLTAVAAGAPEEDKMVPATYGPSPITNLTRSVTPLLSLRTGPEMSCQINGFVATKDLIGGTITIAAATNALNNGTFRIHNVVYVPALPASFIYYYNEPGVTQATNPGNSTTYTLVETAVGRRMDPGVAKLPDGKVLIAGGLIPASVQSGSTGAYSLSGVTLTDLVTNSECARKSAFIYDPATDTHTRTADMLVASKGFRAIVLPDGRIMFALGSSFNTSMLPQTQLYDPFTQTWSDGALCDPLLDEDGLPVMFQGFSGNPPSGTSPSPGFFQGNIISGGRADFGILELRSGQVLIFMGMHTWNPNPVATTNHAALYTPGLPSEGSNLRRIPT